jgi:hypothetical protein
VALEGPREEYLGVFANGKNTGNYQVNTIPTKVFT